MIEPDRFFAQSVKHSLSSLVSILELHPVIRKISDQNLFCWANRFKQGDQFIQNWLAIRHGTTLMARFASIGRFHGNHRLDQFLIGTKQAINDH